jgi:rhamnosyltransferase
MSPADSDVWAVVILYRPDREAVRQQHEALSPQVAGVVYTDNGGGRDVLARLDLVADRRVRCAGDGQNVGIAEGINRGVALAREAGAAFVLLLDQDSVPAPDMVARLATALGRALEGDASVGAVGPAIFDELHGKMEDFGHAVSRLQRRAPPAPGPTDAPVELNYLITSGTLIPVGVLDEVGLMESDLFIDAVDFEWSFRARARGYRLYGTYDAHLHHKRGQGLHRIPILGATIRLHAPERHFYIFRNHLRLCFRPYMPVVWKLRGLWYLVVRTTLFGLFVSGRAAHLAAMARGTWQGLRQGWADARKTSAVSSPKRPPSEVK